MGDNGGGGGGGGGGGDGSGSGSGDQNTPRVDVSVDKTTITSDLGIESVITITATSAMGFAGDVTLTATPEIADWKATLAAATLTVPQGGSATTTVTLSALGDTAALSGNLAINATSTAGSVDTTVAVTFNPVLVVTFKDSGAGRCVYSANRGANNPWLLKVNRQIKVVNGGTNLKLVVHVGNVAGFPHQGNAGTPPGEAYLRTATRVGDVSDFYCHNPNDGATLIEDAASQASRNFIRIVQ